MNDRVARFRALVESQPENPLFRFSLAQALDAAGERESAAVHYRFCADARADWMMPRILLGKALLSTGRPDDRTAARVVLEQALALAIAQDHQDPAIELSGLLNSLD